MQLEAVQEKSVWGANTGFSEKFRKKKVIQNKGNRVIVPFVD